MKKQDKLNEKVAAKNNKMKTLDIDFDSSEE